jgi:hypothetical protein
LGEECVPANCLIEVCVEVLALMVAQRYAVGTTLPGSLIRSKRLGVDQKSTQLLALLFGDVVEVFHLWVSVEALDGGSSFLIDGRLGRVRASGSEYQCHA